jgi:hypothetical protein
MGAMATTAKASLISNRSTSATRPADLLQQLLHGADRGGGEPLRLLRMGGMADDAGERLQAGAPRLVLAHQHQRGGAVGDLGGTGGGDGAVLA